jgi:AcrR family transcriptional regulator
VVTTKRNRLPAAERRAAIIDAAQSVFLETSLGGARTRVIAEQAGITEAVLYQHFASKEAIFEAAILEPMSVMLDELLAQSATVAAEDTPARDRITRLEALWLRSLVEIAPLMGVALFSDLAVGAAAYRERIAPFLHGMQVLVLDAVAGGETAERGRLIVRAAFGMNLALVVDGLYRGRPVDIEDVAAQVANLFATGLSQPT